MNDPVKNPSHYCSHPSGIECIQVTEHMNFCIGNAIKYLWRAGLKTEEGLDDKMKQVQDMRKAIWYIEREINRIQQNEQRIYQRILEPTSASSTDEVRRTHEGSDAVVEELVCHQCGVYTDELFYSFCKRCFTK